MTVPHLSLLCCLSFLLFLLYSFPFCLLIVPGHASFPSLPSHYFQQFPTIPPEHLHHTLMRNDPFWVRVLSDPRLANAAREAAPHFLKDGAALFSSHYFCKVTNAGRKKGRPGWRAHQPSPEYSICAAVFSRRRLCWTL